MKASRVRHEFPMKRVVVCRPLPQTTARRLKSWWKSQCGECHHEIAVDSKHVQRIADEVRLICDQCAELKNAPSEFILSSPVSHAFGTPPSRLLSATFSGVTFPASSRSPALSSAGRGISR